jgi:hypothetical protein
VLPGGGGSAFRRPKGVWFVVSLLNHSLPSTQSPTQVVHCQAEVVCMQLAADHQRCFK